MANETGTKITELPEATSLSAEDLLYIVSSDVSKKITKENFRNDVKPDELLDIRTGSDNELYSGAGESVREQINNLKDDITNKNNSINDLVALDVTIPTYDMLSDKVLNGNGVVTTVTGSEYKVTDYIPVKAGWVIAYKYSRARWNNQNWSFFDKDKNVISTYGKTSSSTSVEIYNKLIVPYRAKYFVLARDENGISDEPASDVLIIKKYSESIDKSSISVKYKIPSGNMNEIAYSGTNMPDKVINSYGVVKSAGSSSYVISEFNVQYGDIINIHNCKALYSNKMYIFYDVSGLPIKFVDREDNNAHDFLMIKVPFGATKLIVSGYGSYATVGKVTEFTISNSSWSDKKWSCIGDSLTDSNNSRATKRYFDYIHDLTGINIVNLGVSGTGYKKAYNTGVPFYQRIDTIPLDSDVITIFGSGNDLSYTLGDVTDTGTETICGCINTTIDGIRARIIGANIGIITPTPWDDFPTENVGNRMDLYANALVEICRRKGVPCLDLYHCSNMLPWELSFREAFYTRDDGNGVHPDENGHKFFAPHIKNFLESLLL